MRPELRSRRRVLALAGFVGVVGVLVAGCSAGSGSDAAVTVTVASTTVESASSEPTATEAAATEEAAAEEEVADTGSLPPEDVTACFQVIDETVGNPDPAGPTYIVILPESIALVNVYLGASATPENAEFESDISDAVNTSADVVEAISGQPLEAELALLDECYLLGGYTPPDRAGGAAAAAPSAPKPIIVEGSGAQVKTIRLKADAPLVVEAEHTGSSNFAVQLVGQGLDDLLFNEIGSVSASVVVAEAVKGKYRLDVDADGQWRLRLTQPSPKAGAKVLPGVVEGSGSTVIPVRLDQTMQPVVRAKHQGESNFVVSLIGYGGLVEGEELLFNEIGNYSGETLTYSELPAGDYLLEVYAPGGTWTLRFRP